MIKDTMSKLNLDGANVKQLKRKDGKLVVIKKPIQSNCTDNVSEVLIYLLSKKLGVPCAEAGILSDKRAYSVVDEKVKPNLVHASEYLKIDDGSIRDIYSKMTRLSMPSKVKFSFLRMTLFDILTRQLDRNLTNFSFIVKEKSIQLYQLYDNGLSLFSTVPYKKDLNFTMRTRDSSDSTLKFCLHELGNLNIPMSKVFKKKITSSELEKLWVAHKKDVRNNFCDIVDWVIRQQDNIYSKIK